MKRLLFLSLVVVLILIIGGLTRSIYGLWRKQDLVSSYQKELSKEKNENQKLKNQLSLVEKSDFLEQQARNNLFLVKPGEQDVIIPKGLLIASNSAKPSETVPNWKKWWSLFLQ
jgi:cell division protein FtsB